MEIKYTGRRTAKREFMMAATRWFARELGLDNCTRNLILVDRSLIDFDPEGNNGATTMDGRDILVYIDQRLGLAAMTECLAHEMVHVRQYARGYLRRDGQRAFWMGRAVRDDVPYLDLPWERQAFGQQAMLTRRFYEAVDRMRGTA